MKDAKGHGSNARGAMPLKGHDYHTKSDSELRFITKDASEAAKNMQGMGNGQAEGKYLDQANDAQTVLGYRARGGSRVSSDADAAKSLASGPKSAPVPMHDAHQGYHAGAVQNAINSSNRHGRKIGGREAKAIHALLRGRY